MSTEWQFADVEHVFRKHANSKSIKYNTSRPLAALDDGAIKRASELLGARTWDDFAKKANRPGRTLRYWNGHLQSITRGTVTDEAFPALCEVAVAPYKQHPEAYNNCSAWLVEYIEQSVAYALTSGTETPEDEASRLNDAWDRYNVATLLYAAFTLQNDELETIANAARYALTAPTLTKPTKHGAKPTSYSDGRMPIIMHKPQDGTQQLITEAKLLEAAAVYRVPEQSRCGVDFDRLKALVSERNTFASQNPSDSL